MTDRIKAFISFCGSILYNLKCDRITIPNSCINLLRNKIDSNQSLHQTKKRKRGSPVMNNLPDHLIEHIADAIAEQNDQNDQNDQNNQNASANFRLVNRRHLQLSSPAMFRHPVVIDELPDAAGVQNLRALYSFARDIVSDDIYRSLIRSLAFRTEAALEHNADQV